jgi:hypothetical protein
MGAQIGNSRVKFLKFLAASLLVATPTVKRPRLPNDNPPPIPRYAWDVYRGSLPLGRPNRRPTAPMRQSNQQRLSSTPTPRSSSPSQFRDRVIAFLGMTCSFDFSKELPMKQRAHE